MDAAQVEGQSAHRTGSGNNDGESVNSSNTHQKPGSTMTGRSGAADGDIRGCQCGASLLDDEAPGPGFERTHRAASDAPLDSDPDPAALEELALAGRLEVVDDEGADDAQGGSETAEGTSGAAASDETDARLEPAGLGDELGGTAQDRAAPAARGSGCGMDGQSLCSVSEALDAATVSLPPHDADSQWCSETPYLQWEASGPDRGLLFASLALVALLSVATRTCR